MRGVVAASNEATAEAGAVILYQGGNAIDAAVAAAFASFIAEPASSTLGGGGYALIHSDTIEPTLYDFCTTLPTRPADTESLDFEGIPVPFDGNLEEVYYVGRGSTAVPGCPAGLLTLLEEGGTLPLDVILEPATLFARDGVYVTAGQASLFRSLAHVLVYEESIASLFTINGKLLQEGDVFYNPDLSTTFDILAKQGYQSFYTGEIGQAILDDHKQNNGLLTHQDLADYHVIKRRPLTLNYKNYSIFTNPPPSGGGILIANALKLLEHANLSNMAYGSTEHIMLLAEIMRQTNLDNKNDNPRSFIQQHEWEFWLQDGRIERNWQEVTRAFSNGPSHVDAPSTHEAGTTHISVIDETGLSVGITMTPGATGGHVIGDTGILTNNMLGEINLNPDGFHNWRDNDRGTRVLSMMAPTVVTNSEGLRLVVGSAGSSRLRSAILQVISNMLDWDIPPYAAVNHYRVHFEDNMLHLEAGYNPDVADELENKGYQVQRWTDRSVYFGGANIALLEPDGHLDGAGDKRRGGEYVIVS